MNVSPNQQTDAWQTPPDPSAKKLTRRIAIASSGAFVAGMIATAKDAPNGFVLATDNPNNGKRSNSSNSSNFDGDQVLRIIKFQNRLLDLLHFGFLKEAHIRYDIHRGAVKLLVEVEQLGLPETQNAARQFRTLIRQGSAVDPKEYANGAKQVYQVLMSELATEESRPETTESEVVKDNLPDPTSAEVFQLADCMDQIIHLREGCRNGPWAIPAYRIAAILGKINLPATRRACPNLSTPLTCMMAGAKSWRMDEETRLENIKTFQMAKLILEEELGQKCS